MAERLGTGLQNLLQQFESAWYLFAMKERLLESLLLFLYLQPSFHCLFHGRFRKQRTNGCPYSGIDVDASR